MKIEVEFSANNTTLRGWLYVPEGARHPLPVIVMAHGFSAIKEMGLERYARVFMEAGLAVLIYDNRNLGASDGEPRYEIDPVAQMRDYRHAITFLESRREINPDRIGLWGTSYSGGLALIAAALDRRVRCVACQGPFISGYETFLQAVAVEDRSSVLRELAAERKSTFLGNNPTVISVCQKDAVPRPMGSSTYDYFHSFSAPDVKTWANKVTLSSRDLRLEYEALPFMERVSPTPLLMIVADSDTIAPTNIALRAYERALEPKKLVLVSGGHYAPYLGAFDVSSRAARDWFVEHLSSPEMDASVA